MASDGEISCTNDPNFAVIYSFLKVFGKLYGLDVPSIAKLQQLLEDTEEVSEPLKELHVRLLRRALKSVQSGRWERCLVKFCHQHGHHQEAWEIERFSYKKASTEVKLKTLKLLLEYQFTCHAKFKSAVNALSCKDLRLEPIGRDKNGCVYWLQVDEEANLCLYKEDQDEETFHLIARNREELVKVIGQLKSGEEICPSTVSNANEDSSSTEVPPPTEKTNTQAEEENEEFLSPESESEHDDEDSKSDKTPKLQPESDKHDNDPDKTIPDNNTDNNTDNKEEQEVEHKLDEQNLEESKLESDAKEDKIAEVKEEILKETDSVNTNLEDVKSNKAIEEEIVEEDKVDKESKATDKETEDKKEEVTDSEDVQTDVNKKDVDITPEENRKSPVQQESSEKKDLNEVSEAIEEPVMVVTGEGSGADCESYFIGEEISEPVMFFYGEGCGYDNDTGNPEVLEETNNDHSDEENDNTEVNGEHSNSVNDISNSSVTKVVNKSVKLKGGLPSVNKRSLKKQSNDNSEVLKLDSKKHCVRKPTRSDSLRSNSSTNDNDVKKEGSANDKTTDSESPNKNNVKKTRGKIKRRPEIAKKAKVSRKEASPASDADENDSKASIIEKRKSSVSSDLDGVENTENEKEGSPEKETKEDDLPPKKLRLEPTPKDIEVSHSKETDTVDNVNKEEAKSENNENDDNVNTEKVEKDPIAMRKKIKANKGKFKRKKILQNKVDNSELDKGSDKVDDKEKTKSKPLKRSLLDANNSDKNKSESQSESEDDMPITSGKRLKIKPKKIITSTRKKVEAKLLEKKSSDDSEEETLYSIAGKKTGKKLLKKKPKGKEVKKVDSEDSDPTPVRQSRRIAQQKIKEEADRRHLEEVALRELKMIHKKKSKDDEEEWRASSSSEPERTPRRPAAARGWRAADTSAGSDSDSDDLSDRPPEPDLVFDKSDHEFSPESDLESGEPSEPLKRARTLQEGTDDGFCKRCGSGEQPEWILLCDKCDAGYHASCLKPMLFLVPAGDWFCPPCNHELLINSLESELVKYDELLQSVEAERKRLRELEPERPPEKPEEKEDAEDSSSSSSWSSGSSQGAVYRLRARRQLPVSYRAQEYDRLISSAIKEEYVEPTTSAGNQGRGKDISTIIEAAEEEKLKAEREEAIAQGKPLSAVRKKKKQRRKPRKLNSLEVVSEDDDETDEDFKDTGMESSSEEISSSAERDSTDSRSSDSLPIRRPCRTDKKDRPKLRESSPEVKKKKGEFAGSSSESSGAKEWPVKTKTKSKSRPPRDKSRKKSKSHKRGLTQYDAEGNVIRPRVTYGGLSDSPNDWSPKHRTRQKKINYTEMPNTESEDEVHKGSGKHMPDSSDEFKVDDSDLTSDSDTERRRHDADKQRALSDLIKTAVVPLEKLPDDVTKAKEQELEAHLNAAAALKRARRGGRGGRGSRGPRGGRGGRSGAPADAFANLVGVKIKDLGQEPITPNQLEKEKKRQEREAKQAEKEAKRMERIQKKEEKDKLKELKAKEREEKRLAKLAVQESKRLKKEKPEFGYSPDMRIPDMRMGMYPPGPNKHPDYPDQRFPPTPRLQVRAELRGVPVAGPLAADQAMREGTLSVAGSPQPFKPVTEEPSVITRMPHMLNHQYRGPMMYGGGNPPYGPRQNMMYVHPGLPRGYPQYYRVPAYPLRPPDTPPHLRPPLHPLPPAHGMPRPMHGNNHPGLPPNHPGLPPNHPPGLPPNHPPGHPPNHPPGLPPNHPPGHPPNHPPGHPPNHPPGMPPNHPSPSSSHPPSPISTIRPGTPHGPSQPHQPSVPHRPPVSHGPTHGHPLATPIPSHGPPQMPHGPPGSIVNHPSHHPSSLHGLLRAGPPVQLQGPRPIRPNLPPGIPPPGIPPTITRPTRPIGPPQTPPHSISPAAPPGPSSNPHATPPLKDPPIKIKAEVKTEPEYHSPAQSPPSEPDPPRPKVKHTNKERRTRHPLGPYAPQYGPYGPYAPDPAMHLPRPQFLPSEPQYLPPYKPEEPRPEPKAPETEASVFGGLVSYFSSQREDELDA